MISRSATEISNPPGARASARTSPRTITDVSRVSDANRCHTPAGSAVFTKTACAIPVPSRMTANATLPDDLRCVIQPCNVTVEPTWSRSSAIRGIKSCMEPGGFERTDGCDVGVHLAVTDRDTLHGWG